MQYSRFYIIPNSLPSRALNEAIATGLEAIASRVEAIASRWRPSLRVEAIATTGLEAIATSKIVEEDQLKGQTPRCTSSNQEVWT